MTELYKYDDNESNYKQMIKIIKDMLLNENDILANLSNISSVIRVYTDRLNWAGFYIMRGGELVLGPFQGLPACVRIRAGKGVCGKAVVEKVAVLVENVHEFPGHIACDSNSNSELVVPLFKNREVFGVLDLDSPDYCRFTEIDKYYFEQVGELISNFITQKNYAL